MAHVHCTMDTKGYKHTLKYVIMIVFHCNNGCTNAPHRYVIRALPVAYIFYHTGDEDTTFLTKRREPQINDTASHYRSPKSIIYFKKSL